MSPAKTSQFIAGTVNFATARSKTRHSPPARPPGRKSWKRTFLLCADSAGPSNFSSCGLLVTKNNRSIQRGFSFEDRGISREQRIDADDMQHVADTVIQPDERELTPGFVAENEDADQRSDGH
jgi:hypothetical protein